MALDTLLATFPRERTWLLPALQAVQRAERYLSPDALEAVAAHLRVPKSEVWGVASHYPELRLARPGRRDRKSTRLNSSHLVISYAVFCLKKKNNITHRSLP